MLLTPDTKKKIITWIIAVVIPIAFILPMYFFTSFGLSNECVIVGVLYLAYAGLTFVVRKGAFDVFAYQFSNWLSSWRKGSVKRYEDAYAYQIKASERRSQHKPVLLPFLIIGTALVIASLLIALITVSSVGK